MLPKSIVKLSVLTVPFKFISPDPLGAIVISPLDADTIELPFTSKSPPNCGEVSETTSAIPVLTETISGFVPSLAEAKII